MYESSQVCLVPTDGDGAGETVPPHLADGLDAAWPGRRAELGTTSSPGLRETDAASGLPRSQEQPEQGKNSPPPTKIRSTVNWQ